MEAEAARAELKLEARLVVEAEAARAELVGDGISWNVSVWEATSSWGISVGAAGTVSMSSPPGLATCIGHASGRR